MKGAITVVWMNMTNLLFPGPHAEPYMVTHHLHLHLLLRAPPASGRPADPQGGEPPGRPRGAGERGRRGGQHQHEGPAQLARGCVRACVWGGGKAAVCACACLREAACLCACAHGFQYFMGWCF